MIIKANLVQTGWNRLDDDFIIYLPKNERYFVLNETAAEVWQLLVTSEKSFKEIVNHFVSHYDCDKEEIQHQIFWT